MAAGVPEPEVFGERVRRKVKRLAAHITGGALEAGAGTGIGR